MSATFLLIFLGKKRNEVLILYIFVWKEFKKSVKLIKFWCRQSRRKNEKVSATFSFSFWKKWNEVLTLLIFGLKNIWRVSKTNQILVPHFVQTDGSLAANQLKLWLEERSRALAIKKTSNEKSQQKQQYFLRGPVH